MIVLINSGSALDRFGRSPYLGRLVAPRDRTTPRPGERWAGDNDAFLAWDEARFLAMLDRLANIPGCLFIATPDVIGDARATLDRFDEWRPAVADRGFPVALVGQDGAEDLALPWGQFSALFVGGTTDWKLSAAVADLCAEAKARGKWLHIGRVNSQKRLRIAYDLGADSIDGTRWSRFSRSCFEQHMPYVNWLHDQGTLFAPNVRHDWGLIAELRREGLSVRAAVAEYARIAGEPISRQGIHHAWRRMDIEPADGSGAFDEPEEGAFDAAIAAAHDARS